MTNANDGVALAKPRPMPPELDASDNRQPTPLAERCIYELFQQRVAAAPNSTAVVFEEQQLTYSELNRRANQLARYLRRHGVGPEVLVGICIQRSLEMIVGMLGIVKAGGAYVPLDPAYPQHRLQFMLEDSGATLLLTQRTLRESLPAEKAHAICLDEDWEKISLESADNIESQAAAENLAYVIYTSGST